MVGVCRPASADQARLFGHEPDVLLVTKAAWLRMGQTCFLLMMTKLLELVFGWLEKKGGDEFEDEGPSSGDAALSLSTRNGGSWGTQCAPWCSPR
jgi:hypothetical protein